MTREEILKVFHSHARHYKNEPNGSRADFTDVDLSGSDLSATNFNNAIFVRAKLVAATMSCSNFYSADFTGADLQRAYLSCADLHGANFKDAILDGAILANADLSGANLAGASLVNAYLPTCNLDCARLNWNSHDLVAEVLRRDAGEDLIRRSVAGLFLASRDVEIGRLLTFQLPSSAWAINELARWVEDGDGAPEILKKRSELYDK